MNNQIKNLIQCVADNDLQKAKVFVRVLVEQDKTQANASFCHSITNKLQASSMNLIELPSHLEGILIMEDVSMSFNEKRYYLSKCEEAVADEVLGMYETSKELSNMGIQYLNSLMLYGESGTGKTIFGRYIAFMLGIPFAYMNFANSISSYLGSTAKNIAKAFDFIEKQKCVFMIDEVDAIGMKRGREDVGEMARIVIGLMQALDRVRNDTVIIGATNRLDMIDSALLRRFAMTHEVKKFSEQETFEMITKYLNDVGVDFSDSDLQGYCQTAQNSQALVMNDVVRAIAKAIRTKSDFRLSGTR